MSDIEHAQSMLRIAYRDFNALIGMEHSPLVADEIFGFHAQQAVEKTCKAWLCAKDIMYPLTHELSRLLSMLENIGENIEEFWPLARFTPYAVQSRYEEGPVINIEPLNRAAMINEIQKLLDRVTVAISKQSS